MRSAEYSEAGALKHALVTGGAGFIGSHLIDSLVANRWRVTVVDNFDPFYSEALKRNNLKHHAANPNFRLIEADVRSRRALRALSGHFDVIVHLAARVGVRPSIKQPALYQSVNVAGTQNMLEFAKARGTPQFVFASSSSVYGASPQVPWREADSVLLPISPYASTKVSGELLGHVYSHLYGIRFIALRFFTVFGPRQRPDLAIHSFAKRMRAGEVIQVFGDGNTRRDYTYVADIVSGIRAAMNYTGSMYEIVNLGNNRTVTLSEMVASLARVLGATPKLSFRPEQAGDVPQTLADIGKARALLGYDPHTDFYEGLAVFTKWLDTEGGPLAMRAAQA
jgi:UDP-glucuronate 4-epimerase